MNREEKLRAIRELDNLPEEIYDGLLRAMVRTTRRQLGELRTAFEQDQEEEIRQLAHSIRGAASNLRLQGIEDAVAALQEAVHEGHGRERTGQRINDLEHSLDDLEQAIETIAQPGTRQ